jgi:hypothetical protein
MTHSFCRLVLVIVSIATVAGCGSDRPQVYPTQGKVVFADGKPVKLGTVELYSDEHKLSAVGTIRNNGSFLLGTFTTDDGAVAGRHRAIVTQMVINDTMTKHVLDHGAPVDPIYGSYNTSPLEVIISGDGPNEITLTVDKAQPPK